MSTKFGKTKNCKIVSGIDDGIFCNINKIRLVRMGPNIYRSLFEQN